MKDEKKKIYQAMVKRHYHELGDPLKKYLIFYPSYYMLRLFSKSSITSYTVTLLSLLIYPVAAIFLAMGQFVIGGLLAYFACILDGVDGRLADIRNTSSRFGIISDKWFDRIGEFFIIIGFSFGLSNLYGGVEIFYLSIMAMFLVTGEQYIEEIYNSHKSKDMPHVFDGIKYSKWSRLYHLTHREFLMIPIIIAAAFAVPIIALYFVVSVRMAVIMLKSYYVLSTFKYYSTKHDFLE